MARNKNILITDLNYKFKQLTQKPYFIFIIAGIVSLLLSLWKALTQDIINSDGVCYLQSAQLVLHKHILALHLCDQSAWPLYQVLIAAVSAVSHFSVLASAQVLNAFLDLCTVIAFLQISRLLTNNKRVHWFALIVILSAHHFNSFRPDIIRDHGYWAFYLLSIFILLRYVLISSKGLQLIYALLWGASICIATLFRVEGAVFFLVVPWVIFCLPAHVKCIGVQSGVIAKPRKTSLGKNPLQKYLRNSLVKYFKYLWVRVGVFLRLNSFLILVIPLVVFLHIRYQGHATSRLNEVVFQATHGLHKLATHWQQAATAMAEHVLSIYSAKDANLILAMAFFGYYLISLFDVLTIAVLGLLIYAILRKCFVISKSSQSVFVIYILVNLGITLFFLFQNFFLARRYMMALALTLMVLVPFALEYLLKQWASRRWPFLLAVFLLIVCSVGGVFQFGHSKRYVQNAGNWLSVNSLPMDKVYSDNLVLLFYSGHFNNALFRHKFLYSRKVLQKQRWRHYDWLALSGPGFAIPQINPVKVFNGPHSQTIKIYRIKRNKG